MKAASRPPFHRLLSLDRLIRAGKYPNARTMADALEVHPRTIYRDLDWLRDDWGAPLAFCHRHNGYYYTNPDFPLPLVRLGEGELVALFLAERLMQQYRGSPILKDLTTALRKLTAHLPDTVTIDLTHLEESYSFRGPDTNVGDLQHFRQMSRAVQEGRQLEMLYWSAARDEECRRIVDPYHLTSVMGDWYLVAYCHLREEVRLFVPGRVRELRETGKRCTRPPDFDLRVYLDSSFRAMRGNGPSQRVALRFTAAVARYVREKVWHPTQQIREEQDGSLVLTLEVSHLHEVKRWALSYGADCEVLEPRELREEVRADAQSMLARYK